MPTVQPTSNKATFRRFCDAMNTRRCGAHLQDDRRGRRARRESSAWLWQHAVEPVDTQAWGQALRALGERAAALLEAGAPPDDTAADALIDELVERHARVLGRADTPGFRGWLSHQLQTHSDPRAARYWELVATVSGGPADSAVRRTAAGFSWLLEPLKCQVAPRARHDGPPGARAG